LFPQSKPLLFVCLGMNTDFKLSVEILVMNVLIYTMVWELNILVIICIDQVISETYTVNLTV